MLLIMKRYTPRYVPKYIRRVHKSNYVYNIVTKVMIVIIIFMASVYFYDIYSEVYGSDKIKENIHVVITEGSGINQIAQTLKEHNIIKHPKIFTIYTKRYSQNAIFQQGEHLLNQSMSYEEIVEVITQIPQNTIPQGAVRITIPEGFELRQITDRLYDAGLIDKEIFMECINNGVFDYSFIDDISRKDNRLEGYLYPATYDILKTDSEYDIISKMLKKFSEVVVPIYEVSGRKETLDEIIIMASLIEREAKLDEERPIVASVFYNRILRKMKLESCASIEYVLKERKEILSLSDTKIDSKYNTYRYSGLPVGPISSPGEPSIMAALYPETTEYLFFTVSSDKSSHVFTKTLKEHEAATRAAQNVQ